MPVYFCCRGDAESAALQEEGAFVVQDTRSRTWFCFERPGHATDITSLFATASELAFVVATQSMVCFIVTDDPDELPERLARREEPAEVQPGELSTWWKRPEG